MLYIMLYHVIAWRRGAALPLGPLGPGGPLPRRPDHGLLGRTKGGVSSRRVVVVVVVVVGVGVGVVVVVVVVL